MMDDRTRELRAVVMGLVRYEGSYCIAADGVSDMFFQGLNNGAGAARIRGLREIRKQYVVPKKYLSDRKLLSNAMISMGQPVFLYSAPDTWAVLCRPFLYLAPPVVVTMEFQKNNMLCCFLTAKTFFAKLRIRYVISKLIGFLPQDIQQSELTMEPFSDDFSQYKEETKDKKKNKKKKKATTEEEATTKKVTKETVEEVADEEIADEKEKDEEITEKETKEEETDDITEASEASEQEEKITETEE